MNLFDRIIFFFADLIQGWQADDGQAGQEDQEGKENRQDKGGGKGNNGKR